MSLLLLLLLLLFLADSDCMLFLRQNSCYCTCCIPSRSRPVLERLRLLFAFASCSQWSPLLLLLVLCPWLSSSQSQFFFVLRRFCLASRHVLLWHRASASTILSSSSSLPFLSSSRSFPCSSSALLGGLVYEGLFLVASFSLCSSPVSLVVEMHGVVMAGELGKNTRHEAGEE